MKTIFTLCLLLCFVSAASSQVLNISQRRLQLAAMDPDVVQLTSMATDDKYMVTANGNGFVEIWDVATGKRLRKIAGNAPPFNEPAFGSAVGIAGGYLIVACKKFGFFTAAVHSIKIATGASVSRLSVNSLELDGPMATEGSRIVIGSPTDNKIVALQINAAGQMSEITGLFDTTLTPTTATVSGDNIGASVAISGEYALAGSPGANSGAGRVFVFDLANGTDSAHAPAGLLAGNAYGSSVGMTGTRVFVGAPNRTGSASQSGAIYAAELPLGGGDELISPSDLAANDHFGASLSVKGNLVAVGVPDRDRLPVTTVPGAATIENAGEIRLYDVTFRSPLGILRPNDYQLLSDAKFGSLLAAMSTGSVLGYGKSHFIFGYIPSVTVFGIARGVLPLEGANTLSAGTPLPFGVGSTLKTLTEAYLGETDALMVLGTTTGSFVGTALLSDLWIGAPFVVAHSGAYAGFPYINAPSNGVRFAGVSNPTSNGPFLTYLIKQKGTGITAANDTFLSARQNIGIAVGETLLAKGQASPFSGSAKYLSIGIPHHDSANTATVGKLVNGSVTAATDSALFLVRPTFAAGGAFTGATIEGTSTTVSDVALGEFAVRVSAAGSARCYSTALTGTGTSTADNAAVFNTNAGLTPIVRKGGNLNTIFDNMKAEAFLGEHNYGSTVLVRATVKIGAPPAVPSLVTAANNEILYCNGLSGRVALLRKGKFIPGYGSGITVKSFLRFQMTQHDTAIVLVGLQGTGVTAANDQAVIHINGGDPNGEMTYRVIAREGDDAPGCSPAKFGVIQKLALNLDGDYALLTSLVGGPAGMDQALFKGHAGDSTKPRGLMVPNLVLRKGQYFDKDGNEKLKSIDIAAPAEASGALGTGLARAVSDGGNLAVKAVFDDGFTIVGSVE